MNKKLLNIINLSSNIDSIYDNIEEQYLDHDYERENLEHYMIVAMFLISIFCLLIVSIDNMCNKIFEYNNNQNKKSHHIYNYNYENSILYAFFYSKYYKNNDNNLNNNQNEKTFAHHIYNYNYENSILYAFFYSKYYKNNNDLSVNNVNIFVCAKMTYNKYE